MKKIISLILFLLCMGVTWADVHVTGAIRYPSPYKGAGDEGYTRAIRMQRHASSTDYTQAPTIAMRSTSTAMGGANGSRGIRYGRAAHMQGFATSATNVRGGIMASNTYEAMSPHKAPHKSQAYPGEPGCYCHDDDGDGVCDHCGAAYEDEYDGCGNEPCWCPLDFDWTVMAFFMALTCAYAMHKTYKRKSIQSVA